MISIRLRHWLMWGVLPATLLVLLYALLGFFLVPRLIRTNAQDFVTQHYHRQLSLGEIRFNPFSLRLDIRDFSLPDADRQPMVAFRHLLVDLTVASVWRRGPDFEAILLEQPFARVLIRKDGSLNLSELALPPAPNARPEPNPRPARLFINRFSVQGGNIAFEDLAHPSEFRTEIKPITFDLRNFSTVGQTGGSYALTGTSDAGERFSWSGSLNTYPLASHGVFEIGNLQAQTLWKYIRDSVHFELPTGRVSLNGDYDFTAATTPVGLTVTVHNVAVDDLGIRPKDGGADDYVKLDHLEVHETRADVAQRAVTIGNVRLAGADIRAWMQTGGGLNLLELAGTAPSAPASSEPPPTNSANPAQLTESAWSVSVPEISLEGLKIRAEDRQVNPAVALQLDALTAHITGFSTSRTSPVGIELSSKVNRDAKLDAKLDVSPDFATVKGQVELDQLDLTAFQPYIAQRTAMTLRSGLASTKLSINRGADGQIAVSGDAQVARLRTVDNVLKQDFIKFEHLQVSGIEYQSQPASVHIHAIVARAPYARVIVEADRTVNVSKVLRSPGAPAAANDAAAGSAAELSSSADSAKASAAAELPSASATGEGNADSAIDTRSAATAASATSVTPAVAADSAAPADSTAVAANSATTSAAASTRSANSRGHKARPERQPVNQAAADAMAIAIDAVRIQDGSANYADFWIQPHFAVGIQSLNGSILGLSSKASARAKVELQGKVDRYAPVHIWGEVNPLAATAYSDINMSFKGVELTSATPYSGHFAGYKIEKGKLSVDIGYKIHNRQLTASHRFVIDQLELGERVESPDAIKLPLKIAIALLKDRNGVIDIDLPVTGSLDDPKFRLGPLIWKAVLGLLTKIATAPFALLGHLFGGGEQMNFIDFRPGSASLDPPEQQKLSSLLKALKEKPQLMLDVPVTFSADVDGPGLAAEHLQDELLALNEGKNGGKKHARSGARAAAATTPPDAAPAASRPPNLTANDSTPTSSTASDSMPATAAGPASPPARPLDPALADPAQRFRLLVALFHANQGKVAALPDSAQAAEAAAKKKLTPDYAPAITDLEAALLPKMPVPDNELETLGKHRAQVIQDALLGAGEVDPSRIFVIGTAPKPAAEKDKVRVELVLK